MLFRSFARDEGIREDATLVSMGRLKALLPNGMVTAGNASQQNDAAAGCLVVAEDRLRALGPAVARWGWSVAWAPYMLQAQLRDRGLPSSRRRLG